MTIHEHHVEIIYSADKFKFSTKIFYHDVSFSIYLRLIISLVYLTWMRIAILLVVI
ncbi:hypothetical protein PN450_23375 [Dolichospermum lemmermannii CS-548]|nr:hypothetical protein [Dolichospermum lemmermannii CS-548]